jgi:uncharacterized protein (TIGR03067 family)
MGRAAGTGMASAEVAALTEGELRAMMLSKMKPILAIALAVVVGGAVAVVHIRSLPKAGGGAYAGPPGDGKPAGKTTSDRERLQGTWQVVEISLRGEASEKVPEDQGKRVRAVFTGDQLEWRGFKMTYTLDPTKAPKQMDWSPVEAEEKAGKVLAIYELDGDTLKVCMANPGVDRPGEFKSVAGGNREGTVKVLVFKRVPRMDDKE